MDRPVNQTNINTNGNLAEYKQEIPPVKDLNPRSPALRSGALGPITITSYCYLYLMLHKIYSVLTCDILGIGLLQVQYLF